MLVILYCKIHSIRINQMAEQYNTRSSVEGKTSFYSFITLQAPIDDLQQYLAHIHFKSIDFLSKSKFN